MAVATWVTAPASGLAHQSEDASPCWYAAYTSANHEKRVAEQLGARSIEHVLALYETVRTWKDRRKRLELPLFPGYVFVRLPLSERLRVIELPGVARLVGFGGRPAAIPDSEVEALRNVLERGPRGAPSIPGDRAADAHRSRPARRLRRDSGSKERAVSPGPFHHSYPARSGCGNRFDRRGAGLAVGICRLVRDQIRS